MSLFRRWLLPAMLGTTLVPSGIVIVSRRYHAAVSRVLRGARS
jgi:hypothetical protein